MWKFAQFASPIKEVGETGDSNDCEEVDTLLDVVHGYRENFCYLINNIVLPGNFKFERLLREFLYMRSIEGELISEAARIGRELARLQECEMEFGPNVKQKLSDLSSSLQKVKGRSERYQMEFSHIERELSGRTSAILELSSRISSVRVSVLNMWAMIHDTSDLDLICSHNIDVTRKEEFKTITFWHSNATVSALQELLAEDLQILAECHASFQNIIVSLQESIDYMRKGLAVQTHS